MPTMVQSLCPRCGKHTDGEMLDHDLYILVVCDQCEVILAVMPKFYQKATWKAGKARAVDDEAEEIDPKKSGAKEKGEKPGAAVIRELERKKKTEDRRLRWS